MIPSRFVQNRVWMRATALASPLVLAAGLVVAGVAVGVAGPLVACLRRRKAAADGETLAPLRIGLNEDGSLDEIVAHHPESVHLEKMADGVWWMMIRPGGGRPDIHVDLSTDYGDVAEQHVAPIHARVEVEP